MLTKLEKTERTGLGMKNASSVFMIRVVYILGNWVQESMFRGGKIYVKLGIVHRKRAVDTMTLGEWMGEWDPKRSPTFKD